ncbi:MAG TPA: hypothetical protein VGO68_12915 [Pyrinomonadaceae bacterium]|jgi:hypothetical protein|nr:hypothetical protein [Pyrinomonadaceae bacterium]
MRLYIVLMIGLVLVGGSACSPLATQKTETAVEQSIEKFHAQVNAESYAEVYEQADPALRSRVSLEDFTTQLRDVHEQVGPISAKAHVYIDDGVRRAIRRTLNGGWEQVAYGTFLGNEKIIAQEKFTWTVQKDQPMLASYEFRRLCYKPCSIGIVGP